jgi:hypothetical protein
VVFTRILVLPLHETLVGSFLQGAEVCTGTAPLNGECAQRDFPRATSWALGQARLTPANQRWQVIGNTYEIAVKVSSDWRKLGLTHQLLACAMAFESVEELLILGFGLSWHWDYERLGISRFHYREMIARISSFYLTLYHPSCRWLFRIGTKSIIKK